MTLSQTRLLANLLFCAGVALVGLAWHDTVRHLAYILWNRDIYSHGLLVPIVSLWLVWRRVMDERMPTPKAHAPSALLVPVAAVVWMLGVALEARLLEHIAIIGAVQAMVLMVYGPAFYRQILFPMLFLFLMVPIGGGLVGVLQRVTAEAVIWLLGVAGVPHEAEGVLIQLQNGLYEVAAACAGLKFLITSVVTGLLLCHLAFKSWKRRALMLLASILVPIVANIIRVFTTLLIAEATDQDFAKSIDHIVYGWVFLSIVLIILITGAYRFSDRPTGAVRVAAPINWQDWQPRLFLLVAVLPVGASLWMTGSVQGPQCTIPPVEQPLCDTCEFRPLPTLVNQQPYGLQGADASEAFLYRDGGQRIAVYAALFAPDRNHHRLVQGGQFTLRDQWLVLAGAPTEDIVHDGVPYREQVLWRERDRQLVWRSYHAGGSFHRGATAAKMAMARDRLLARSPMAAELIISTDMSEGIEPARAHLRKFLSTFPADSFLWDQLIDPEGKAVCVE